MASKFKQRGWLNVLAAAIPAVVGAMSQNDTNEQNQGINSAQMAFNAAEAQKNRDFQMETRATQYQAAVGDMRKAGLNPMLAYQQGGAGTPSGATASAGPMQRMENPSQSAANSALAAATIKQIQAQTDKTEAETAVVKEQLPMTIASTGKIKQETDNLNLQIEKMKYEMANIRQDTHVKYQQEKLQEAQTWLTEIQQRLAEGNINYLEAQTQTQRVITQLKNYEIPGAKNLANWEKFMSDEKAGNAMKATRAVVDTVKAIKGK